ncbi:TOM1-like protein 2 [Sparganum proliferum]
MLEWFFGGKPQIVKEIETATDSPFSQPDQAAFLEICDHINQEKNGPGIALSALFKQLERSAAGNQKTAVFTLTLLDVCVRNCGYRFLVELCEGNYLNKLKKLVEKRQLSPAARNKLLTLIKVLALAFSDYVDFQPISALYSELLRNEVHFPTVEENDVDLLKRALSPPRSCGDQRPDAPNAKTAQRMQAIRQDLHLVSLDLPAFEALLQGLACSSPDAATLKQLRTTADRLEGLQRRLRAYIGQLSESTDPKSGALQEEEEDALGEVIRVDEKIRDAIQQFQSFERMRRREEEESEKEIHPEGTPTEAPARDPGTVVSEGFAASNAPESTVEVPQNSTYDNFPHRLSPSSDDIQLIDLSEEEIHPEGTPTGAPARDTGTVVSKGFVASNAPESTVEASQNSIYNNSPHRLPPSADLQLIDLSGAAAGGQEWTTANGPASGTSTVPGSGHAAFEAVAEAAQSVISGQSTFPDAQLTDERGAAGRQEWTTTNGPASATSTVPGRGQTAFGAVAEAAQTANVGQSTAFVDTHLADRPGAVTGGQESTTAGDAASGTGAAPRSGHAAFDGVAEAAQTANVGQSAFVDTHLADQPGASAGGQESTTAGDSTSGTGAVPGSGHAAFDGVAEAAQTANVGQSAFVDTHLADQFSTLTTQDSTANEVSDLRKVVAPIPNTEFVTLPDESRRLDSQITPQMMAQMQDADALEQHAAQRTPNGPSVDQLRATILQLLTTVKPNVKSARDLLGDVTVPGNQVKDSDVLQIKNLCTAIQDDLQKLSDLRVDYEWMTTHCAPRPNADGTTDVDPLLMDLYIVSSEANGVLEDSALFLDSNMAVLEHEGAVQHAGEGTPAEPPLNELKAAISVILGRVKTNVASLNDFLRGVNTPGAPVTSSTFMSIKNLSTAIQDDLQNLSRMQVDYECMTTQCPPRSKADGASDVDPLLMDLYTVPEEAGRALDASKLFLDTAGTYLQEDVSNSATDGQEFLHDGSGGLRHGDNGSINAESNIFNF